MSKHFFEWRQYVSIRCTASVNSAALVVTSGLQLPKTRLWRTIFRDVGAQSIGGLNEGGRVIMYDGMRHKGVPFETHQQAAFSVRQTSLRIVRTSGTEAARWAQSSLVRSRRRRRILHGPYLGDSGEPKDDLFAAWLHS